MTKRKRCRKVRKFMRAVPECKPEQIPRLVSEHLSECEACNSLQAALQKVEAVLIGSKLRVDEMARQSRITKGRILTEVAPLMEHRDKGVRREPSVRRLRRLAWASGLVVLAVVVSSSVACFRLSKKVGALRQELQVAQRDVAVFRAEERLKEVQQRQDEEQKAISALHLRMGELMQQLDRLYLPRTALLPPEAGDL